MWMAMSSWLESVMIAFAPCFLTTCTAPSRAMSGALPELASTRAKRNSGWPACFNAWFAVPIASRMESAQLGVAMDPVRSMTCPRVTVAVFAPSCLQAAHARIAIAATRTTLVISSPMRGGARPSDSDAPSARGQKQCRRSLAGGGPSHRVRAGGSRHVLRRVASSRSRCKVLPVALAWRHPLHAGGNASRSLFPGCLVGTGNALRRPREVSADAEAARVGVSGSLDRRLDGRRYVHRVDADRSVRSGGGAGRKSAGDRRFGAAGLLIRPGAGPGVVQPQLGGGPGDVDGSSSASLELTADQLLRGSRSAVASAGCASGEAGLSQTGAFLSGGLFDFAFGAQGLPADFGTPGAAGAAITVVVAGGAASTTIIGGGGSPGCCALRRSLSVFAVPVLVAVATADGGGFFAASPSASIILSLLCSRNSRSFSATLRSASRSWLTSDSRDFSASFCASRPSAVAA